MSRDDVSRRCVLGALSVGAAGAAVGVVPSAVNGSSPGSPLTGREPVASGDTPASPSARELCAPLAEGSTLGRWRIEELLPVHGGAATVVMSDAHGQRFQIDICARDDAADASRGPGRTERFDLIVANRGDGSTSTHEDHGLAAMALAEIVRANEHVVDASAFRTLRQRLDADSVRLVVT